MGNEVFEQKANDILDLDRRVLGRLMGDETSPVLELRPSRAASG
jgi:phosphoenolpyruvate-protein kinase (PTS system EI component)